MLDFTKKINLEPKWRKIYQVLRILLYSVSIISLFFLAHSIIFPSVDFSYSFSDNISLDENDPINPRDSDNIPLEKGTLSENKDLLIDTSLTGTFSNVAVDLILKDDIKIAPENSFFIRKSYQAFFYPTGEPVGFRDGNLLFSDGNFYIISEGMKRKFSSQKIVQELGFSLGMFTIVDPQELNYNKEGATIDELFYPNGMIFLIDGNYYQLINNALSPFVSEKAFLSRYDAKVAVKKEVDFFEKLKISDEQIGLADGTLAAVGEAVLILSDKKSYPIFSPKVFEDMGFNWNDIYPANSEEIAIYEKQRLFIKGVVHPNGTIFKDIKTNIYYIIENGQKRPILGKYLLESYLKISPVLADSTNLDNPLSCTIKKSKFSFKNKYFCIIPLEKMIQEKGNYYQFTGKFSSKIDINQIKINFDTALSMNNLKGSLSRIKTLILTNYKAK